MSYDETQTEQRKPGEKISRFVPEYEVSPRKGKEAFVDATKRMPDDLVDHDDIEKALDGMGLNHGAVSPDMIADVMGDEGRYAVFAGETAENDPTMFTLSESFLFTELHPGQPVEYPGFTLTWLGHNGQVAIKAHKDAQRPVTVSGYLMDDQRLPLQR